ncbi:MAG: formylglycine-generating enzyme family protein [bacterium]|nr:formylglycine-generating enzyme family protein [bacterium]
MRHKQGRVCGGAVVVGLACAMANPAWAVELSVWALADDHGVNPVSIAYNPVNGKLLIAGDDLIEWEYAATNGLVLVPNANWGGSPMGCVYVPSRGTYMVTDGVNETIVEVTPGAAGQTPPVFVDVTAANPLYEPQGGLPQDGTYAYYKAQWTGVEQTVRRFTLVGTNGVDSEHVSYAAFQAWSSSGPSQEMTMDSTNTLHLSARNSTIKANKGIYRWDAAGGALVPVIQEPAIKAHTGKTNATIYGMTFDAQDNLYFYDIYSSSILRVDLQGELSTFLHSSEIKDFMGDPSMSVHVSYMTVVGNELVFVTGNVSKHVLAARVSLVEPDMVTIPGVDYEVDGPTYTYEIGKYELTVAEYCLFLNDAEWTQQTNPDDPRCSNMWIDEANGDVSMTSVFDIDRVLYRTSDFRSKIKYNAAEPYGNRFYVLAPYENHPVVTVSWYGAVKFCNWLTIDAGMDASELCYHEGAEQDDWYPVTAADFPSSGLTTSERLDLVRDYRGYRLPMDGISAGMWNNVAAPYNEWYKAAAFDPAAPDTVRAGPGSGELVQPDHWIFGYGADTNTNADANLFNSGDPFEYTSGHSPVGWYDGVNLLSGGTPTNDTGNRYGLYDMCANVAEWGTDKSTGSPNFRSTRSGRHTISASYYATNSFLLFTTGRLASQNNIGFRLLRSPGYGDFDGDGDVGLDDYAFFADAMTGPVDLITPGYGYEACDYNGDDHVDLSDFARFQQLLGAAP